MASTSLARVIPLVSLLVFGAWAQSTNIARCSPGFEWNRNSLGEDPCTIGAKLDAVCRGPVSYGYPPLNINQYYLPPRKDHPAELNCDCNTVMYNFYMACASCQGAQINSWPTWITACETVQVARLPITIPQGTAVPHWAYFNVASAAGQTYDEATMINIGRDPEVEPTPTNSTTGSVGQEPNVGAIVGGVVGSIVVIVLAGVAYYRMKKTRAEDTEEGPFPTSGPDETFQHKPEAPPTNHPHPANSDPAAHKPSGPSEKRPQNLTSTSSAKPSDPPKKRPQNLTSTSSAKQTTTTNPAPGPPPNRPRPRCGCGKIG